MAPRRSPEILSYRRRAHFEGFARRHVVLVHDCDDFNVRLLKDTTCCCYTSSVVLVERRAGHRRASPRQ